MKPRQRLLFVLIGAIASASTQACMLAFPDKALAEKGRNIVVGVVLGTELKDRPPGAGVAGVAASHGRSMGQPELLAKVQVQEVLRGSAPAVVTGVSPCNFPLAAGQRVIVATYGGRRVVYAAHMYEPAFRAVHEAGAKQ